STGALAVDKHAITATYGGDGNFLGSVSTAVTVQVFLQYTPGVFDPATATWYLRSSNTAGAPDSGPFQYGAPGWTPVVGDWNDDGTFTVGVVNPLGPGGTLQWFLRNSNSSGTPDFTPFTFGLSGWRPITGDWTGQGMTTIGAVDPSTNTWYLHNS